MNHFAPNLLNLNSSILNEIVSSKLSLLRQLGPEMGETIPAKRESPITEFGKDPFLICEIKRKSPSAGIIAEDLDPVKQADNYVKHGIKNISVLTENRFFGGSLSDIYIIKKQFPHVSVLRKDFILEEEEIEVSYRIGADAVLLIASILEREKLEYLYRKAISFNLTPLVEVGELNDIEKISNLKPVLVGINSRNLRSFYVDPARPITLKKHINWSCHLIYESGVKSIEQVLTAVSSGFNGVLVGQSVMQNPHLIPELLKGLKEKKRDFWIKIFNRIQPDVPLVKICGITNVDDALTAAEYGADIIGFVFAKSPRKADYSLPEKLSDLQVLKSAVVVTDESGGKLDERVIHLLEDGLIDVIQFHGNESPENCFMMAYPYYKAVRVKCIKDIEYATKYRCPRVLFDTFSEKNIGGTGKQIENNLVIHAKDRFPLWLAGGIGPENVKNIITHYSPELIDASSRLEMYPGKKDRGKLKIFFEEIKRAKDI